MQPKALPKRPVAKPRPTGKQHAQALRARRSAARNQHKAPPKARQHASKTPKTHRNNRGVEPQVEGQWVFIPKQRNPTGEEPPRLALDETAPPSYLTAQAAAVSMFATFVAVLSTFALPLAQHTTN